MSSRDRGRFYSFFNMGHSGLFLDLFFSFSWYIVRLQLIYFTMVNDDRRRKEEGRVCTVVLHLIRKSPTPSNIDSNYDPIKPRSSRDSNEGCSGRVTLLHCLRHHCQGQFYSFQLDKNHSKLCLLGLVFFKIMLIQLLLILV